MYYSDISGDFNASNAVAFARTRLDFHPDPVQAQVLNPNIRQGILNCTRQWGKSTTLAVKAVHHAFTRPHSLTLCISASGRQSALFLEKCRAFLRKLDIPVQSDPDHRLSACLPNGARIIGLPGRDDTTRGFSAVSLLLVDEASRVSDDIIMAMMPAMAAVPDAAFWLLSTPNGCDNFFYQIWTNEHDYPDWTRIQVTAPECPRISPTVLENQRREMAPSMFEQEYLCKFVSADDAIYSIDDLLPLLDDFPALVPQRLKLPGDNRLTSIAGPLLVAGQALSRNYQILDQNFLLGVDLGRNRDYSALAVIERSYVVTELRDPVTFRQHALDLHRLVHLERFPLGTPYTEIGQQLNRLLSFAPFSERAQLAVDATGVGAPFVDMLRTYIKVPKHKLLPVVITGGTTVNKQPKSYNVPREVLLHTLESITKQGTLRVSKHLPLAIPFFRELAQLRVTTTASGHQSVQTERSTQHDDMVFAVALAAFANCGYKPPNSRSPFAPTTQPAAYFLC